MGLHLLITEKYGTTKLHQEYKTMISATHLAEEETHFKGIYYLPKEHVQI